MKSKKQKQIEARDRRKNNIQQYMVEMVEARTTCLNEELRNTVLSSLQKKIDKAAADIAALNSKLGGE